MQASRLVSILLLLQTRGQVTARELAAELEVSLRTIYRDLDGLAEAGIPVYAERGPTGGYRLVEGYRTRLTGLNPEEAEALFLSGIGGAAAQLGLGTVLAAAQLKVLAAMPPELRGRAARVRERFLLVAPGWFKEGEDLPALASIAQAVWEGRRLRLTYAAAGSASASQPPAERVIEPMGLVIQAGIWYLVARRDGTFRTYRVSRVQTVESLDETFERPNGFDLETHWARSAEAFATTLRRVEIQLRVRRRAIPELEYAVGSGRVVVTSGAPDDRDAWVKATLHTDDLATAHDDLLRLGADLEVLAPPELRERLVATVARMRELYAA